MYYYIASFSSKEDNLSVMFDYGPVTSEGLAKLQNVINAFPAIDIAVGRLH